MGDEEWYPATVDQANDDGTFTISWDDDGDEPCKCAEKDMRLQEPRMPVSEGDEIDVWVSRVTADGKLGLTMVEGMTTGRRAPKDFSGFQDMDSDAWIDGKVTTITNFGIFVEVADEKGNPAQGLVHVSRIKDGFVEDPWAEADVGQD